MLDSEVPLLSLGQPSHFLHSEIRPLAGVSPITPSSGCGDLVLSEPGHSNRHKMGSKYPRSLRCCLPLWAFVLQVAFIILFFFISYDTPRVDQKLMETYQGEGPGEVAKWARGRAGLCSPSHGTGVPFHTSPKGGSSCTEVSQCGLGFVSFMSPNWICDHGAGELFVRPVS